MRPLLVWLLTLGAIFAAEPLRIGVILPLSGNMDYIGQQCRQALQMSYEDIPVAERSRYQLFFEDDQADLKQSILAARRLIDTRRVDILMTFGAGTMKVIAPIALQKDIVHLNLSISHDLADGRNNFTFWGRSSDGAPLVVRQLLAEGKKRVAVLNVKTDPSMRQTNAFIAEAEKNEIQIVAHESFNPDERDFRVILLKLKEAHPDAIFVYSWTPGIDIIASQMRQLGLKIPVTSIESLMFVEDKSLINGSWFATASFPTQKFSERFERRYGHPAKFAESNFYDYLQFISVVCKQYSDRKPTRAEIARGLLAIKDRASATGVISINEKGQIVVPTHLVKIVDGKVVLFVP
jgi:branched-chain amino acid transport system substrate-binding protein